MSEFKPNAFNTFLGVSMRPIIFMYNCSVTPSLP